MIKLNNNFFKKLDKDLTLIPLTYDRAFKKIFEYNIDILRYLLKEIMPIPIDDNCKITVLDSELPVENKKESNKIIDIYVVLDGKKYVDIEMNRSKFEYILERNIKYQNKLSSLLLEWGEKINTLKEKQLYQINLNVHQDEEVLDDIIVYYGIKTHKIYSKNECMVVKNLERYRDLYYNENERGKDVIWLTALTSRTFSELYKLVSQILPEKEVKILMEAAISMSKDKFVLHEWQKDKLDKLVIDTAKDKGIEEGKSIGRQEGIKENTTQITKNLLKESVDIETISKVTGLTKEEIKNLEEK